MSNPPDQPDFSDIPTEAPPNMYNVGNEGQTPADVINLILGGDSKEDLAIIMRSNFTEEECTVIMRVLVTARFGLMADGKVPTQWAMPWLKEAVIRLAQPRVSTGFHSVNKAVEALSSMKSKTEQQIKMSQI